MRKNGTAALVWIVVRMKDGSVERRLNWSKTEVLDDLEWEGKKVAYVEQEGNRNRVFGGRV